MPALIDDPSVPAPWKRVKDEATGACPHPGMGAAPPAAHGAAAARTAPGSRRLPRA